MKKTAFKTLEILILLSIFLFFFRESTPLNQFVSDLKFKLRGPQSPSGDIVLVTIDEASMQLGRWPWRRDLLGLLTERVFELGAKNVGFDILFTEKQADQAKADAVFAKVLEKHASQITLAWFKDENGEIHRNIGLFSTIIPSQGFVNTPRDSDGIFRTADYYMRSDRKEPSLALALISQRLGTSPEALISQDSSPIRHLGPARTFPTHTALDILREEKNGANTPISLKDKTVLIGVSAMGVGDMQTTPFGSEIPGVEIQASLAEQILSRNLPKRIKGLDWFLGLSFAGLLIFFGRRFNTKSFLFFSSIAIVLFSLFDFFVLFPQNFYIKSGSIYAAAGFIILCTLSDKFYEQTKQKRFIRDAFSKYLAPDVVKKLLAQPDSLKLGGEKRELTVLFCDLRNFTTISETLEPTLLTQLLNETFTLLTGIIFKHKGTVDKYIGDALMAFFGAPIEQLDQAFNACLAAKEMATEFHRLQPEFKRKYGVELSLGIGINSGLCLVGNIGSEQRFNYSALGDAVNIASRVESCNKEFGTEILITQAVLDAIKNEKKALPAHRFVSSPVLKGRSTPTALFALE